MRAYYNEINPHAAATLRLLIEEDFIASGDVDERSIEDVTPNDLSGYTQCHFFAGIGLWSLALRQAGWSDEWPIWTGSCPCQPFSAAGKGGGFTDERHLWPAFHWLIQQCGPGRVVGEQVKNGMWLDLAQSDMEGLGYTFGCSPLAAGGFGAPFIGDRAYWVAEAEWYEQPREESCSWKARRVGRLIEPVSKDRPWPIALAEFRVLDDGYPRCVGATDAIRNGMHVPTVTAFIKALMAFKKS